MKKAYLGIDPGVNGAIAILWGDGTIDAYKCPKDVNKMSLLIKQVANHCIVENYRLITGIERVWTLPRDGRKGAFTFGMNYGMWFGITANYELNLVTPQKWQSHYGELPKDKTLKKRKLKEIATEIVNNNVKPTLCTSDAILIANYGKENYE